MSIRLTLPAADIKVGPRLRRPLPDRVTALSQSIAANGQDTPIAVAETSEGMELIAGAHRLAAIKLLGRETIEANVFLKLELKTVHEKRLLEIRENMERFELNALEHAENIADWRSSYEAIHGKVKRGGDRRKKSYQQSIEEQSTEFVLCFSDAAQNAFKISRQSVYSALKVASIPSKIKDRITEHSLAENQSELLAVASFDEGMQFKICDMILADPPQAKSVSEAHFIISKQRKPKQRTPWEKVSGYFSALAPKDQSKFFELHAEAIEKWYASRGN